MHADRVVRQGQRPKPDVSWPRSWLLLQQSCWSSNPKERPTFDALCQELDNILNEMHEDEGAIPTRARELIRAKKKRKPVAEHNLDVDTRILSGAPAGEEGAILSDAAESTSKRFDTDVV